jgi:excinuclease ABC subunit C
MMSDELKIFVANLTHDCGVYRMLDAQGIVLYVGKAKSLKKRVASYFNKQGLSVKTRILVEQIALIEVSVTRTETEALLLESNLIKSLRPKYNVLMRDDKTYPFIHVSMHTYPRIEVVRYKKKPKKGFFYGPYPSVNAVREALTTIQKIFKIRPCRDSFFNTRSRPCLQYQIQRCSAPCTNYISVHDYQQTVDDVTYFLMGKNQLVLNKLAKRMDQAVAGLDFEIAAGLRDQIKRLRLVQEQQGMVQQRGDADVIVLDMTNDFVGLQCVSIREGDVISSQSFFPKIPDNLLIIDEEQPEQALYQAVLSAFIAFYYLDMPERIPALIILQQPTTDDSLKTLLTDLRGLPCQIQTKPTVKTARWIGFAVDNLQRAINERLTSKAHIVKRYQALKTLLRKEQDIHRMECFDISHTQGNLTVASCVVFDKMGPRKKDYKRFNINGITPGDDYAAMEQALTRRFRHNEPGIEQTWHHPDVLIIDGGKGQVGVARRVLEDLNVIDVMLIGIAKGPGRKAGLERLIIDADSSEISLPADSPALHLLQHIRDEAHRFAITTHRKKRQKSALDSSLETLEGVGPKRRKALLQRFGGMRELTKAPVEEIAKVEGISEVLAQRIFDHFHK